jgi:hypothetical protein
MKISHFQSYLELKKIYQEYYVEKPETKSASSYWSEAIAKFKVTLSTDGHLQSLVGNSFHSFQQKSFKGMMIGLANLFMMICFSQYRWPIIKTYFLLIKKEIQSKGILAIENKDYPVIKLLYVVAFLAETITKNKIKKILIIGDGGGIFSCLLKILYPKLRICIIDLPQVTFFQAVNLEKKFPQAKHLLMSNSTIISSQLFESADFVYCPVPALENFEKSEIKFDLAVNIFSMQEMNFKTVEYYFQLIKRKLHNRGFFYCCNRVEKTLPDGELIKFENFPFPEDANTSIDESPDFFKCFFSLDPDVWVFSWLPFFSKYRGKIRHKLLQYF